MFSKGHFIPSMTLFRDNRSVFDSLDKLYRFLNAKYLEEISKSKNPKQKKNNYIFEQQKNDNANVTADIIYSLNRNKNAPSISEKKVYNLKTMKVQTKKKKKNSHPPIDYDPIPFNFLSKRYKYEKTQVDSSNEENFCIEKQNHYDDLVENYELVNYLTNNKIKSKVFSIWTKKFYYSLINKKSNKPNGFYFETNDNNLDHAQSYNYTQCKNDQYPHFLFDSAESTSESNQDFKKISNYKSNIEPKNQKKKIDSNVVSFPPKDDRDVYVDIVLSEYT